MDTQRLILFVIFSFSALFLYESWQRTQHPPALPVPSAVAPSSSSAAGALPQVSGTTAPAVPPAATSAAPATGEKIQVKTDLYVADVDTLGGVITQVALAAHRDFKDESKPYLLLQQNADRTFVAETGLLGDGMPNHRTLWAPLPGARELAPGVDKVDLAMQAVAANGAKIVRTLTFHRGSYLIDVAYTITNNAATPIAPYAYFQFTRDIKVQGVQNSMAPAAYTGPVLYNETDKFKKIDHGELDKLAADSSRKLPYTKNTDNGWVGMVEHYFVAAWMPSDQTHAPREFYAKKLDNGLYADGVIVPIPAIAAGATAQLDVPLYVGPQEQDILKTLPKGMDLVVDYGIFTIIAAPLFWLLKELHSFVGNWGWAIVLLTILIKSAFYPLNHASARSMAKMKVIGPKLKALQEQYAKDKQQLQIKMMEMYKTEKINPLGGCLPILVQIPVFIALYWVLLSAVELRHAPWIGWIHDLSAPDPFFVLPVLYAITAYLQVRLSPTPIQDPVQAKVMQIMPIAFSVMFIFFPAGLVLYWLINNSLQIFQQWHMNRVIARETAAAVAKRR